MVANPYMVKFSRMTRDIGNMVDMKRQQYQNNQHSNQPQMSNSNDEVV